MTSDYSSLLKRIGECCPVFVPVTPQRKTEAEAPAFENLRMSPLRNTVLLQYLAKRGIPADIASEECVEVHYSIRGRENFSVGFRSRSGGIELRNPYFKGAVSPKDITCIRRDNGNRVNDTVLVFEGFMDYLSYLTLKRGFPVPDCVVLNSASNLPKAMDVLKGYSHVRCFLDNDRTGRNATQEIIRQCGKVSDMAVHYMPHKDLNEFLMARLGIAARLQKKEERNNG